MDKLKLIENRNELTEHKAEEIERLFRPMVERIREIEEQYNAIVNETEINETVSGKAKLLGKQLAAMRKAAEKAKTAGKKAVLTEGNAIQGAYNIVKYAIESKEKVLKAIAKHAEIIEEERIEKLRAERSLALSRHTDIEPIGLGEMDKAVWNAYYKGVELAENQRIAAEKQAEKDRIAKEKAELAERELIRKENERLKKEAAEKEAAFKKEQEKAAEKLKSERIKAAKEAAEKEAKEKAERKRLSDIEAKKQAEIQAKLETERKAKEKIEAEIKRKEAKEAAEKANTERIAKAKAAAPDKDKLLQLALDLRHFNLPEMATPEAKKILKNISILLDKTVHFTTEQAEKL